MTGGAHSVPWSPKGRRDSLGFTALRRFPEGDAMMLNLKSYQRGGRHSRHGEQHPWARSQKVVAPDKVRSPKRLPYRGMAKSRRAEPENRTGLHQKEPHVL